MPRITKYDLLEQLAQAAEAIARMRGHGTDAAQPWEIAAYKARQWAKDIRRARGVAPRIKRSRNLGK
jgi:hypothetical protein